MRKSLLILLLILGGTLLAAPVWAVEAGGEIGLSYSGSWPANGTFTGEFTDYLDLELYLPPLGETEFNYAFRVTSPLQGLTAGQETVYFTKKLYLKHKFKPFHLTVGRQPVSWSFGSMLNPVDYTLGAVALDQETNGKYVDAVEVYIPLNWNSNLSLITSFPAGFDLTTEQLKWGLRGRFGIKGYDLTINYVQEAAGGPGEYGYGSGVVSFPRQRAGFTFKGDLGDLGVYGALGYYFGETGENSNSYLLGVDYSYNVGYYGKLTMQMEYLGLDGSNLAQLLGPFIMMSGGEERTHLLTCALAYPLDDFSSIGLTAIANLDGSKYLVIPRYQNTLPGNIDLDLSFLFYLRDSEPNTASIVAGLNYPF